MTTTHMPRAYENIYHSHNDAFWWEQGRLPKLVSKWLERQGKEMILGFLWWLGGRPRVRASTQIWTSHWFQRREPLGFLITLPRCEAEREGGWGEKLKRYQQLNMKNWSHTLYCNAGHHWMMQTDISFVSEFFIDLTAAVLCKEGQESRRVLFVCCLAMASCWPCIYTYRQRLELSLSESWQYNLCSLGNTREWEASKELLGGDIPHSLLCLPWEVVMKQFPITSRAQIRFGAFCPAHLRLEVQNRRLLSCSLQLAPQHQGLLQIVERASDPFCVSIVLCGVWGKGLALLVYPSFHSLCKKLSQSKNVLLYHYCQIFTLCFALPSIYEVRSL